MTLKWALEAITVPFYIKDHFFFFFLIMYQAHESQGETLSPSETHYHLGQGYLTVQQDRCQFWAHLLSICAALSTHLDGIIASKKGPKHVQSQ